jgi:hypothetical protein
MLNNAPQHFDCNPVSAQVFQSSIWRSRLNGIWGLRNGQTLFSYMETATDERPRVEVIGCDDFDLAP